MINFRLKNVGKLSLFVNCLFFISLFVANYFEKDVFFITLCLAIINYASSFVNYNFYKESCRKNKDFELENERLVLDFARLKKFSNDQAFHIRNLRFEIIQRNLEEKKYENLL